MMIGCDHEVAGRGLLPERCHKAGSWAASNGGFYCTEHIGIYGGAKNAPTREVVVNFGTNPENWA